MSRESRIKRIKQYFIRDQLASTLWGNSTSSRDQYARFLVLPTVFSIIIVLVDVIIFLDSKRGNGGISINLPILLGIHLIYAIGMVLWIMQKKAELDHVYDHVELQKSFREELLNARDLNAITEALFKYIALCVPIVGGAFYYERAPGGGYELMEEVWLNHQRKSAAPSEVAVQSCVSCIPERPEFSQMMTNPFHWVNHGSFETRSKIICRWINLDNQNVARICLYSKSSDDLSKIQGDYLSRLLADSVPAIRWVRMRESSAPLNTSSETERIQMAHYLHDTLVNDLSFLNFKIEQIQNLTAAKKASGLQPDLHILGIIARRSYKQVREALYRLRDSAPADLDFALRQCIDDVGSRANLEIDFVREGQPQSLAPEVNRNILYIVREALRNVEKHANASHVDVLMKWDFESLKINISDNGIGFILDAIDQDKKHFGLNIVHECAEEINADLEIDSVLNGGTRLTVTLPL